ncbi:MAG: hypothetical protein KAU95_01035 [Candidatus Aenigmarchaeota archaeon]|nr:hypothetical protein [Candidatus Aenigmarchaeota archaeon]
MRGKETFEDVIKRYGGKDITICAEDQETKRYVVPKGAKECKDISKMTYKKINKALKEEGIYSISFLSERNVTEIVAQEEKIPAIRGVDYTLMKNTNPEDWVRLREMFPEKMEVYDPDNLQSIYQ